METSTVHPVISEVYYAEKDDWVEISNPSSSTSTINLSLYRLRDTSKTNKVDLQGSLPPGGYAVYAFGNKLNNAGDTVRLVKVTDEAEVDTLSFGKNAVCKAEMGQSVFRVAGSLKVGEPTKGTENKNGSICVAQTTEPKQATVSPTPVSTTLPTSSPEVLASTSAPIVSSVVTTLPVPTVVTSAPLPTASVLYELDQNKETTLSYSPLGYVFVSLGVVFLVTSVVLCIFCIRRYNKKHGYDKSIDQPLN